MNKVWFEKYFKLYKKPLFDEKIIKKLTNLKIYLENTNKNKKKTMILGNGGSAAISSHVAVDFSKNAKVRMKIKISTSPFHLVSSIPLYLLRSESYKFPVNSNKQKLTKKETIFFW
jgi:hypothetical protein